MADFIPPKNEVPEREISERAVTQVSGEWYVSQLSGRPDPPARAPVEREPMQRISGVRPATMQSPFASPASAAVATSIEPPRPVSPYAVQDGTSKPAVKRQIVCFTFYKVMPEWRRLPPAEKALQKAEFADVLNRWNKPGEFLSLTYSTVGTRGDVDFCVWSIGYAVDELNRMRAELLRTPMGGYLTTPHSFLAMTKRSQYQIDRPDESEGEGRGAIRPGGQKYIFIYPFWKTRQWYLLSAAERKRLMDEHIRIGLLYPRVKLNTTYSFGIDDQEFVVAFETNFPEDFLDLVQQLRETEISLYTLKDYPIFSCVRLQPLEMLDRIG
jgi:chlorite dismutase